MIPFKESILEQKEQLYGVKVECFTEIQKMAHKVKVLEKHLEIVSQINLKVESLQVKIGELDRWSNKEKSVLSSLPAVKTYENLVTVATTSITLSYATGHNVTMLNHKLSQAEYENV